MTATDPLLSIGDLADYLAVPVTTIRDWRSRNYGPAAIKVGGQLRWRRQAVETWLAANTEKPSRRSA